ncbi:MAG: hypothetical protein ACWGO1_11575, partial [Anaerolineales bacterium]
MRFTAFKNRTLPFVLLAICVLAFGLLIPWLGFYQDDWYQVWFGRAFGSRVFVDYYAGERPFIAGIYMLTMPLIGTSPFSWQTFGLLSRFLAVLATYWLLRVVWPERRQQALWTAAVFAVYPAFRQQYASVIYSHYFLQMAVQMLSLGSMVLAIRQPHRFWRLNFFSLLSGTFSLFTSEYFFGLELIRPLFIWIALGERPDLNWRERGMRLLRLWTPYLVILMVFVVWRIFIFQFPTYQPIVMGEAPPSYPVLLTGLLRTILQDVLEVGLLTWGQTVGQFADLSTCQPSALAAVALSLISAALLAVYLLKQQVACGGAGEPEEQERKEAWSWVVVGLASLLAAGWPFWFVGLPVDTQLVGGSRFTISFMFGASLLIVGLLDLLLRRTWLKIVIVSAIVGLAIGYHFRDANYYRQIHRTQAEFFQQLAWRAPGLKPGTLILTNIFQEPILNGDNSLTAALNWIYDPTPPYTLNYMLFYLPSRIESGNLPGLEPGMPVVKELRNACFTGSTSGALAVYYAPSRCLRVLDADIEIGFSRLPGMPREIREAARISNLAQIVPDADTPARLPAALFRYLPPEGEWCYYYEKAELARQEGDWQEISRLADEALSGDVKIDSSLELLPFIEGYARTGQVEKARQHIGQYHPVTMLPTM